MVLRVKHQVVVGPGGSIAISDPCLPIGSRAEVVIEFEASTNPVKSKRELLRELQQSLNLSKEQGDAWRAEIRAERDAWRLPQ